MPIFVRTGRLDDVDDLLKLARSGGSGLTNLPPDANALKAKLAASEAVIAGGGGHGPAILVLEIEGRVQGCGMIFPRIGTDWPFYSYRTSRNTQRSLVNGQRISFETLTLTNDFDGCAEVGGLLIDAGLKGRGLGALMARSRYLFIASHREYFGARVIAELRGVQVGGRSPFWDAVGGRFYGMEFEEADRLNALAGNQIIADLGPRHPIHVNMLSSEAQAVIGHPHDDGVAAYAMLKAEGFRDDGYVDIFDAGPTLHSDIDALASIRSSKSERVAAIGHRPSDSAPVDSLIAAHRGSQFRVVRGAICHGETGLAIEATVAEGLKISKNADVRHIRF